jgi:sec-independent protein translocase protein TatA
MGSFSPIHWIIVIVLVMLLFGGGRVSSMMGDVAKGIKSFKRGMAEDEDIVPTKPAQKIEAQPVPPQPAQHATSEQPSESKPG